MSPTSLPLLPRSHQSANGLVHKDYLGALSASSRSPHQYPRPHFLSSGAQRLFYPHFTDKET